MCCERAQGGGPAWDAGGGCREQLDRVSTTRGNLAEMLLATSNNNCMHHLMHARRLQTLSFLPLLCAPAPVSIHKESEV